MEHDPDYRDGGDSLCTRIDSYLSGDLSPAECDVFEQHLSSCGSCREIVAEQRWIDSLLKSNEARQLQLPSAETKARLESTLHGGPSGVWQTKALVGAAAVAAILLIAVGLGRSRSQSDNDASIRAPAETDVASGIATPELTTENATAPMPDEETDADGAVLANVEDVSTPSPRKPDADAAAPTATFVGNRDVIAVPLESDAHDVSIVQLYHTVDSQRRFQSVALFSNRISGD